MRKLLNNPWFVAVAALVALLMVGHSVLAAMGGAGANPVVASPELAAGGEISEEAVPVLPANEALQALAVPASVRDPFAARAKPEVVVEAAAVPDFVDRVHLSAIWTQGNATLVLINQRICEAGDEIGRVKIESASQDGVWVRHWKGRDFISLGAEFVLNTPASVAPANNAVLSAL